MIAKQIFTEAAVIIIISAIVGLGMNGLRPQGIRLFPGSNPLTADTETETEAGIGEIPLSDALEIHKREMAVFADARSASDYEQGRIRGAVNVPIIEFESAIDDFLSAVDPEATIITYSDGPVCDLGKSLAEELHMLGFDVYYLTNGWNRWKEAGGPVTIPEEETHAGAAESKKSSGRAHR